MISVMDFSVCAPVTMTSTSSILDAFHCDCRRPCIDDALPGLGDDRDFIPETVTDFGRLIVAKVATTLTDEERREATRYQNAARKLVPHVPVKWLVPAYHQSMMTCRHLRRTLEDVVKKPEL
uniref:Protein kinase domain-containing protein n=1 Tax=Panagrellus redivivus TaxID=6233 RepID=A0A7E4UYR6_PANRE